VPLETRRARATWALAGVLLVGAATAAADSSAFLEIRRKLGAREYAGAAALAREALRQDPRSLPVLEALVEAGQASGAPRDALGPIAELIEADPGNARAHYAAGLVHQNAKEHDEALAAFRRAVALLPELVVSYREIAYTHSLRKTLDAGRAELQAMCDAHDERAGPHYGLAFAYALGHDPAQALAALERARALAPDLLDAYRYASAIHFRGGDFAEALALAGELQRRAQAQGDRLLEGMALNTAAAASLRLAAYTDAVWYYEAALRQQRELGDRQGVWASLDGLGVAHERLGLYEKARGYHRQALAAAEPLANPAWKATTLHNLGVVRAEEKNLPEARGYYFQALRLRRDIDRRSQAYTLRDIGMSYLREGRPAQARPYLEEAAAHAATAQDALLHALIENAVAESHQQAGALVEARRHFEAARREGERIRQPEVRWRAERGLGGVCEAEGRLTEAHGHYARAIEAIEATRRNVHEEGARTIFLQGKMTAYEAMVRLLHRLHRGAPSAGWDRQALEYAERARARTFLDRLAEARAEIRKGMTPAQLDEERRLLREAARIQKLLLRETPDEAQRAGQEKELEAAMDRLEAFEDGRRRQSPEYAALRRPEPENIETVQAQLAPSRDLLVQFMLGDEVSYAWLVSHRSVRMAALPGRDRLERQVGRYRALIGRPPTRDGVAQSVRLGRALFETLFAGFGAALEGATGLTIVPDGALHYLPFESLVRGLETGGAPRYLLDSHDITYVPSGSALVSLNRRPEGPAARLALLAYGDPELDAGLPAVEAAPRPPSLRSAGARMPLLHARREVESIARLYPPALRRVRLGNDASERAFKREDLARFRILHLATHGMSDPRVPARSGLLLAPGGADEDGLLQELEIVNLDLDADLVVLSACGSGLGRIVKGEGLVGVTRAFFYGGARRVVVSLWDIDDQSTAALMESFYRRLQAGTAPAWALRDAKREVARSDRPAHRFPYYWASFVMVGSSPPSVGSSGLPLR